METQPQKCFRRVSNFGIEAASPEEAPCPEGEEAICVWERLFLMSSCFYLKIKKNYKNFKYYRKTTPPSN
jgi:hypothetical protein